MKYIDLHCDALTKGGGVFQVTGEALRRADCALQCFAAFVEERKGAFARVIKILDGFPAYCAREGIERKNALLTVENGAALEGNLQNLYALYARGVRMLTLTWNYENELGTPCFANFKGGTRGHGCRRMGDGGLTAFGREVVEVIEALGMLVDVSHGSDALLADVADMAKRPFVASHSDADAVHSHPRNLTDEEIRRIADAGGVIGLNFCMEHLTDDRTPAGVRTALLAHAAHMLRVGGEDCLALGSDFDGIPPNCYVKSADDMPKLLEDFAETFGERIAEKIAYVNAARVLREGGIL